MNAAMNQHSTGYRLLHDPRLIKGTAFTEQERDALGLRGFLPAHVFSMQTQVERVMANLRELPPQPVKGVDGPVQVFTLAS